MKYLNNKTLITEYKKVLLDNGIKQQYVADKLGISKQSLNLKLNKKHINFDDMQALLDVIGYDLIIDFEKRDWSITPMYISNVDKYRAIIYIVFGFVHDLRCG